MSREETLIASMLSIPPPTMIGSLCILVKALDVAMDVVLVKVEMAVEVVDTTGTDSNTDTDCNTGIDIHLDRFDR